MQKTVTDALDKFSQGALCTWLNRPGATAAVATLALGAITVPDPFTTAAGLGLLATQAACAFNPNPSDDQAVWTGEFVNVCACDDQNGYNRVYVTDSGGERDYWTSLAGLEDFEFRRETIPNEGNPYYIFFLKGKYCGNTSGDWDFEVQKTSFSDVVEVVQEADLSLPCVGNPVTPPPNPRPEPITGESQDLGCTLTADLGAWVQSPNGTIVPVIKYSSQGTGVRADGGIISGCNWYGDLVYVGGDGDGPPRVTPFPPDVPWPPEGPGIPDWLQDLFSSLASNLLYDQLSNLLAPPYAGAKYELFSVCELDGQGNPEQRLIEVDIPAIKGAQAIVSRIDALIPLLQGQKDFKQPVCPPPKPQGEFRTIGFISDEVSPNGKSPIRKRLRYRSMSGLGLDALIDYWKDFQFNAGPVIVQHRGASWGTVKCWAASANEGKRIIRHAAGEAGIDADKTGRWEISGSSSSRLGMPGTMKVNQSGGYYWITARDGSDNRPLVCQT